MNKANYDSITTMLRAEHDDTLHIDGFGEWTVIERKQTYFGPRLLLVASDMDYNLNTRLTAPGPNSELKLWWPDRDEPGWRLGWVEGPEVSAELVDTKQYDICQQCGEPLKTAEHIRQSAFGVCAMEGEDE